MDTTIIEQVKTACPCFGDKSDTEMNAMIESLISLLSVSLCWTDDNYNSFIFGERKEIFTYVNDDCFSCKPCEQYHKYPLFYIADKSETEIISVTLNTYVGLETKQYVLPPDTYTVRNKELIIDTAKLPKSSCTCSCEEFELIVEYNAGYKQIPEKLLPIFCSLLTTISLSLLGCGSVNDCRSMDKPKAYQIIKSKKVGEISRTWTVDTTHVSYIYSQMFTQNQLALLAQMSLCNQLNLNERLWLVKSC